MAEEERQILDYRNPDTRGRRRVSRLAVLAAVLSLVGPPLLGRINSWLFPDDMDPAFDMARDSLVILGVPLVGLALGIAALWQFRLARGHPIDRLLAFVGIGSALMWLALLIPYFLMPYAFDK